MPGFDKVFDQLPPDHACADAMLDKGYDSNPMRARLQENGIHPVIPPKSKRKELIVYEKDTYQLREQVERFFKRLKQFRRIATRYEKLGHTFLAFIYIVAACVIVK